MVVVSISLYWLPLGAGEMWNSNSVISWLIAGAGFDVRSINLPRGGRAPGWNAGFLVAARGNPRRARGV
jgi:hypothetical protein